MAIHIQQGKDQISLIGTNQSKVHSIPCKIYADCDAQVKDYFQSSIRDNGAQPLKASFRGYPLRGSTVDIPEGYTGIVLHESIAPLREKDERKMHIINRFNSITYWNWDKAPSKNDKIIQALEWIDIAEALHSPIEEL